MKEFHDSYLVKSLTSSPLCLINTTFGFLNAAATSAKSLQSCPTLCYPIDSSPPGSPIPGILQARTLEWVSHKKEQIVHKLYTFENTTVVQLK